MNGEEAWHLSQRAFASTMPPLSSKSATIERFFPFTTALSHTLLREFFFHLSRETTITISLIQFLLNLAYINSFEKRIREKKNIESCSRVLVGE